MKNSLQPNIGKTNLFLLSGLMLFVLTLSQMGCKKDEIASKSFHYDEMAEALEAQFGSGCVGFQYSISANGIPKAGNAMGKAGLPSNGVDIDYTTTHRKSMHSCSKTISAAAMLHALTLNGIDPSASIATYLPNRWNISNIVDVSFDQILTHTSGFRGTRDSYTSIKNYVIDSTLDAETYAYANINFSIMRLLIPSIDPTSKAELESIYVNDGEEAYAEEVANRYVQYVRDHVLVPAGVSNLVAPKIWDDFEISVPTYNYNYTNQTLAGYSHSDQTLLTGAGGWYMNAHEYNSFLAYLTEGELANIDMETLMDNNYGMFQRTRGSVLYYTHNGAFTNGDSLGGRSIWIYIPATHTAVVVQINSANNAFSLSALQNGIIDEYLKSYY